MGVGLGWICQLPARSVRSIDEPPGASPTSLRDVAASDPDLAVHARRRLATAEGLSDSFLNTPAAARLGGVVAAAPEEPASGAALPAAERYELGQCLGEGGMGRVLVAFDRQLGRSVALKFLTHQEPAVLRLFLREARAQARVEHAHVLEIYDSGELDGQPFIAMRYVAGGTLAEVPATLSLEHKVRLLARSPWASTPPTAGACCTATTRAV